MWVRLLALRDFRNYEELEVDFPPPGVSLVGPNGAGKTNLLEAVHLLLSGRALRAGREKELIRWGAESYVVRAAVSREEGETEVEVRGEARGQEGSGRRTVLVNSTRVPSHDLPGFFSSVVFTPDDLELIKGSPKVRRAFLDRLLAGASSYYRHHLVRYERLLSQRNHVLRMAGGRVPAAGSELLRLHELFTESLLEVGSRLLERRRAALARLARAAAQAYAMIDDPSPVGADETGASGGAGGRSSLLGEPRLSIRYVPVAAPEEEVETGPSENGPPDLPWDLARCREELVAIWRRVERWEWQQGRSLVGPHRDDIELLAGGINLRTYGSQGQQRSVVLALKLAELNFLREETGRWPVLLLDDVFSELDPVRRARFMAALPAGVQVFLTCAEPGLVDQLSVGGRPTFAVEGGRLTPV